MTQKDNHIMTYNRFLEIQKEVVDTLCSSLRKVRDKSFPDFVLLLAKGDYYELLSRTDIDLSPYVIEDPTADYMDRTRLNFLASYINDYSARLREDIYSDDDAREYEMSIQMMVYTHVWESHLMLKDLERIANILAGKGYVWKSSVKSTKKSSFIRQNIITKLQGADNALANILKNSYSDQLRNDFAHSTYYLDFKDGMIYSHGHTLYGGPNISFLDWEEKFMYSIMLSYHLIKLLDEIKHSFIDDYGAEPILVERPLKANKQKRQRFLIVPKLDPAYNDGHIRFDFVRKGENG